MIHSCVPDDSDDGFTEMKSKGEGRVLAQGRITNVPATPHISGGRTVVGPREVDEKCDGKVTSNRRNLPPLSPSLPAVS